MYVPIGQPNVFALNMYTLTLSDHPPTLRPSRHLVFAYFFSGGGLPKPRDRTVQARFWLFVWSEWLRIELGMTRASMP